MSRAVREVVVARPPERVFSALADPGERARWVTTLVEAPGPAALAVGDKVQATRRGSTSGSRYVLTVVALDPPRRLAMDVDRNGARVGRNSFELEPVAGGTRVRGVVEVQLSGVQRMMTGVVVAAAEKELTSELAALKRHVEAGP